MSFFLFLLVNATLFIRPAEVVPAVHGWKIYEALILACFAAALPEILAHFTRRPPGSEPVTLCVFGLLLAVPLSHLGSANAEKAWETGFEFFKVVVYYVLLVSVINTPDRLRRFLYWVLGCCVVMVLVALLRFHGLIEIQAPPDPTPPQPGQKASVGEIPGAEAFVKEAYWDPARQEVVEFRRLGGTGRFKDPNDLCLAIVLAVPLCLYGLSDPRLGFARLLFIPALVVLGLALQGTLSRGGFLGLCAALMTLFWGRYGWRKTLALGALALPVLFVLFAGRMTNIQTGTGTGQDRIQLWSDWLQAFRGAPLLGVGPGTTEEVGLSLLAHNAFLQAYADLGLLGGPLFAGAFYFAILTLRRARTAPVVSEEMGRLRPYLLAVLAGAAVCLLTLSLTYVIPTYLILGLATAYAGVAPAPRAEPLLRCDLQFVQRLAVVAVGALATIYVFMRVFRA
jgi:hypothetical protein